MATTNSSTTGCDADRGGAIFSRFEISTPPGIVTVSVVGALLPLKAITPVAWSNPASARKANSFRLRTSSNQSMLSGLMEACADASSRTRHAVIAGAGIEDSITRRRALPNVKPKPRSRGSSMNVVELSIVSFSIVLGRTRSSQFLSFISKTYCLSSRPNVIDTAIRPVRRCEQLLQRYSGGIEECAAGRDQFAPEPLLRARLPEDLGVETAKRA